MEAICLPGKCRRLPWHLPILRKNLKMQRFVLFKGKKHKKPAKAAKTSQNVAVNSVQLLATQAAACTKLFSQRASFPSSLSASFAFHGTWYLASMPDLEASSIKIWNMFLRDFVEKKLSFNVVLRWVAHENMDEYSNEGCASSNLQTWSHLESHVTIVTSGLADGGATPQGQLAICKVHRVIDVWKVPMWRSFVSFDEDFSRLNKSDTKDPRSFGRHQKQPDKHAFNCAIATLLSFLATLKRYFNKCRAAQFLAKFPKKESVSVGFLQESNQSERM